MNYKPKVSIGLPVYNGENYISDQIESILNQNFTDFELIISDNASFDDTEDICRSYANKDKRIKYFRFVENCGASKNYNFTFDKASGKYFKWAAHDDSMQPGYLQNCVNVLDHNPDVILCHTEVRIIDRNGKLVKKYKSPLTNVSSTKPHERYGDILLKEHHYFDFFGLARTDIMGKTKLHGNHLGADSNYIGEMALRGRFTIYPKYLYNMREHSEQSIRVTARGSNGRAVWFDPKNKGKRMYEHPRFLIESIKSIQRVKLSPIERFRSYEQLFKWAWRKRRHFAYDLYTINPFFRDLFKGYTRVKKIEKRVIHEKTTQGESILN